MDHPTRLEKNRSGIYEIRWTEKGAGRARTRSVSTRQADIELAEAVRRNFLRGENENAVRAAGTTVGALLDGYAAGALARGVSRSHRHVIKVVRRNFGAFAVDDLTPDAILDYAAGRGVTGSTVRRELATLVAALSWAVKHRKIAAAPAIDLPPDGAPRAVFLEKVPANELFTLAAREAWPNGRLSRIGRFICIGLDTGARKSAIEGLTWDRVDLTRRVIDFRDPTLRVTKKRRVATPITDRLMAVLERAKRERPEGTRFVLDIGGETKKAWRNFMLRHGYEDVTPHVLRHTRITLLLQAGVSVWDVSGLVGASPDVIQSVYGHHVTDDRLHALANRAAG